MATKIAKGDVGDIDIDPSELDLQEQEQEQLLRRRSSRVEQLAVALQQSAKRTYSRVIHVTKDNVAYNLMTAGQKRAYKAVIVAFKVHAVVYTAICSMLFLLNLFIVFSFRTRVLWSFFVAIPWFGALAIHFGTSYVFLSANQLPTKDLDDIADVVREVFVKYVLPRIESIRENGITNPFPRNSKMAKAYDFLFKPA